MKKEAYISDCGNYRPWLKRSFGGDESNKSVVFIGVNPSTADATKDDPTIRRCINFAKDWGYDSLIMLNLFSYRATNPQALKTTLDPVGPDNDKFLIDLTKNAVIVIAAWGVNGGYIGRDLYVCKLLEKNKIQLYCLAKTANDYPRHPLYVKKTVLPITFEHPQSHLF